MDNFGETVKFLRGKHSLSLSQLSEKSGVAITTIHNYERGVEPTLKKADQILSALDVSLILGKKK